ncbi:hypothetical protein ES708_26055 [subsurface metagenome]
MNQAKENYYSNTDIAYLAGLVDGEGSIVVHRTRPQKNRQRGNGKFYSDKTPRFVVDIAVSMTDKNTIYWIKSLFGGCVYKRADNRQERYRDLYCWQIRANKAIAVMKLLLPYLRTKKYQAILCTTFQEKLILKRNKIWGKQITEKQLDKRESFYRTNKAMNRGWSPDDESFIPDRCAEYY